MRSDLKPLKSKKKMEIQKVAFLKVQFEVKKCVCINQVESIGDPLHDM